LFAGLASTAFFIHGCGDLSCGAGTRDVDGVCVPDGPDQGAQVDLAGSIPGCGPNTQLNATTNQCELIASACQGGTEFDPMTLSCKPPSAIYGTQIFSTNMTKVWNGVAQQTGADGGFTYTALGDFFKQTLMGLPDSTLLYFPNGVPVGDFGSLPVRWNSTAVLSTTIASFDHQMTLGEFKTCNGSYAIFKDPPGGKKVYKYVVDLAGCPPGMLIDTWAVFSREKDCAMDTAGMCAAFDQRQFSTPFGGVPNSFETDGRGNGHWERDINPTVWLASNATLTGNTHGATANVPDLTTYPNASVYLSLIYHLYGQTNGNMGNCVRDANNNCITPQPNAVFLPGRFGVDTATLIQGVGMNSTSTPLSMVQPY
jgi:hypothetical protein